MQPPAEINLTLQDDTNVLVINLTLQDDDTNVLVMDLERDSLRETCIYFKKMLANFQEKDKSTITMRVPNAGVMYEVIQSLCCGKKFNCDLMEWEYLLEGIRCLEYLNIDSAYLHPLLYQIKVPVEGCELLLSVIDQLGIDCHKSKAIRNNLPEGYSAHMLPKKLAHSSILFPYPHSNYEIIVIMECGKIIIINPTEDTITRTIPGNNVPVMSSSYNGKQLVISKKDGTFDVWDMETGKLINTFAKGSGSGHIHLSPDGKKVIDWYKTDAGDTINVWNAETGYCVSTVPADTCRNMTSVCYAPNSKDLTIGYRKGRIRIWDDEKYVLLRSRRWRHTKPIISMNYSFDGTKFVAGNSIGRIGTWSKNEPLPRLPFRPVQKMTRESSLSKLVDHVCYSPDIKFIAFSKDDGSVIIVENIYPSEEPLHTITPPDNNCRVINICFSPDSKHIIIGYRSEESLASTTHCQQYHGGTIKIIDLNTGILINRFENEVDRLCNIYCMPINKTSKK